MYAIVPPEPLYSELHEIKEYVAKKYHTTEALRRPVHITMIAPFSAQGSIEPKLKTFIDSFAATYERFDILIDGFGTFYSNVLFFQPVESPELMKLQKDLARKFTKVHLRKERRPSSGFHPHITLAYKDISRPNFAKAREEYQEKIFRRRFTLDYLCLMKFDKGWTTIHKGFLGVKSKIKEEPLSLF